MAQQITAGTGNRLESSAPVSGPPFTVATWFKYASAGGQGRLMTLTDQSDSGANNYYYLHAQGTTAGDPVRFAVSTGSAGNAYEAETSTGYSINTSHHACGVSRSGSSRDVYIDGGSKGSSTDSNTPTGIDWFGMQVFLYNTSSYVGSGANVTMAESAVWDIALSDAEVASLGKGARPLLVHPESIVAYWPLGQKYGNHYNDLFGGHTLSKTGTVAVATGPQIIYPSMPHVGVTIAAAPPAAGPPLLTLLGVG